jgi:hypothetical protein
MESNSLRAAEPVPERYESLEQARAIIGTFIERYDHEWLIERLGHRRPAQVRADALGRTT